MTPTCYLVTALTLMAAAPAFATLRDVDVNSASPMPPYTNWPTAASAIQDAVDAALRRATRSWSSTGFSPPIQVIDPNRGKLLALDLAGQGGFVAVARLPGSSEIVVVTSSIWWLWLNKPEDKSDNERLIQNLLAPPGDKRNQPNEQPAVCVSHN